MKEKISKVPKDQQTQLSTHKPISEESLGAFDTHVGRHLAGVEINGDTPKIPDELPGLHLGRHIAHIKNEEISSEDTDFPSGLGNHLAGPQDL